MQKAVRTWSSPGPSSPVDGAALGPYLVRYCGCSTYTPSWYLSGTVSRSRLASVLAAWEASMMCWDLIASASMETQPGEENILLKYQPPSLSGCWEVSGLKGWEGGKPLHRSARKSLTTQFHSSPRPSGSHNTTPWCPQPFFFHLENVTKVVINRDEVINVKKRSYFALAMIIKLSELILVISFWLGVRLAGFNIHEEVVS